LIISVCLNGQSQDDQLFQKVFWNAIRNRPFEPIAIDKIHGFEEARATLENNCGCAKRLFGANYLNAGGRLAHMPFFVISNAVTSFELAPGRLVTQYAWNPIINGRSSIVLLQPFFKPESTLLKRLSGKVVRWSTLDCFETMHGLRAGSLNGKLLAAILLLHEAGHVERRLVNDTGDTQRSMDNTRIVIRYCFPELLLTRTVQ
jgi:hypothetical protein